MPLKPWMKWYPADWRSDPKLRMCGLAARGLWADMLALMHEAAPYGHLLVNQKPPTLKQLALLVGATERDCRTLVDELRAAGVFSETEEGVIYSRRMVRDEQKATQDRENGKGGGNPKLRGADNEGVNPQDNGEDKAQRLEARGQKQERKTRARGALSAEDQAEFDLWWPHYPHKAGKVEAAPAFVAARRKATLEELIEGAKRYGLVLAKPNAPSPKFPQGWLNGERWKDEIAPALTAVPPTTPSNLTPDENDRLIRLERLLGGGDWRLHHGPKPSPDEARAELAHLVAKRDGRAAA